MTKNEKPTLVVPTRAELDRAVRQKYILLRALEAALTTCVTRENIPPNVIWQAVSELCAKQLATVATHVSQERGEQRAFIEDAIQDLGDTTYDWLRELREE